tara:strand:+ start:118 stop:516 length:399 start_codon:yes stop_codon:yes gene_type:complete
MIDRQIRLTQDNLENHLGLYDESKGVLLKYRLSDWGTVYYDISCLHNDWHYGILSEIAYISPQWCMPPKQGSSVTTRLVDMQEHSADVNSTRVYYDLWVWSITDGGAKESLSLDAYEIYLIKALNKTNNSVV